MHQSLDFIPTPVYLANKKAYKEGWPVICNEGGSRSGKTYSTIQLLIHIAAKWKPGIRISIVSHSLPHIKRGAYRDFKLIMEEWGLWDDDKFSFTDFVYTFDNGSYIELFGLDDEKRARGPGRDLLFVNEANLITKPIYSQLAMRTTGQKILDWNPADFNSWVYGLADNPKNKCIHSTYLNNYSNLSTGQIEEIESYRDLPDDFMWKVYGLGERGAAKELIYTNWKMYTDPPPSGDVFYGLDFGYTNPCAMVKVTHYEGSNYVQEVLYQSGLTVPELIQRIKQIVPGRAPIYADSAEPKSIEELHRAGFNVHSSDKDVWAGIVKVKSYPLFIFSGSKNLISEAQSYKWRKDKNDEILEEPVKAHDHLCFIGSTLIKCLGGLKQIKDVTTYDRVLTSEGYQSVTKNISNGCNKVRDFTIKFSKFDIVITSTPDHLIKTDQGWKAISSLQQGQKVSLPKSLTANDLLNMQAKGIIRMGLFYYIGTFGSFIIGQMGQYQRAFMSTTKTKIATITIFRTLNYLLAINTYRGILKRDLQTIQNGLKNFIGRVLKPLQHGISRPKGANGTSNTRRIIISDISLMDSGDAKFVTVSSKQNHQSKDFVPTNANPNTEETPGLIRLPGFALNVAKDSMQINIQKQSFAENHVVLAIAGKDAGKQNVYDLEVHGVHEYFANGLLVHNCDATRYAIHTHLTKPQISFIRL